MFSSRKTAAPSTGYNLTKSLRFRSSASAYLSRTPAGAGNQTVWTWSKWVKRGTLGSIQTLFDAYTNGSNSSSISFTSADQLQVSNYVSASLVTNKVTTQVFRDPSAWYHIVVSSNGSTSLNIYVNGVQVTSFATNVGPTAANWFFNGANNHRIGTEASGGSPTQLFDGYLTEVNFIDGQSLTPSSFGSTNALTGVWQPARYTGTYGTNGFYLPFTNTTSTTTLGYDFSPNGNNWTTNNISLTAGSTYDSMTDVPTLTSATAANFCTLNPLNNIGTYATFSNGNLTVINTSAASHSQFAGTMGMTSSTSKIYWEVTTQGDASTRTAAGIGSNIITGNNLAGLSAGQYTWYVGGAAAIYWEPAGGASPFNVAWVTGDILNFAYDPATGNLFAGKNGTYYSSAGATTGNPATGANPTAVLTNTNTQFPIGSVYNAGTNSYLYYNFGQQPWANTIPSGFAGLNTYNL